MRRETMRIYNVWRNMKSRCNRPRKNHGESRYENITYCSEWEKFEPFQEWATKNGYTDELRLDRINNDGNYEPSNCRFITNKENSNNRSNNRIIEYNGESRTLSEWADKLGIHYKTLISRLNHGWSIEKAFFQVANQSKSQRLAIKNRPRDEKGRLI